MIYHRRKPGVGRGERRGSRRWRANRPITWCVQRGRRQRKGIIVERSLSGLVIRALPGEESPAGTRLRPTTLGACECLGFHSAVVQRVEAPERNVRLIYAEIEA